MGETIKTIDEFICLHNQILCDSMDSLFSNLRQILVYILIVFILINNQILSTANAKDIYTDSYI